MDSWQSRVQSLLKQKKIRGYELADRIGVSQPTFSGWMNKRTKCSLEYRQKIARELDTTIEYLDTGQEKTLDTHETVIIDTQHLDEYMTNLEPAMPEGYGNWGSPDDDQLDRDIKKLLQAEAYYSSMPDGFKAEVTLKAFSHVSDQSFVIKMPDDTMINPTSPTNVFIPKGSQITIDPERQPEPGEAVLIRLDGEYLFRIWMPIGKDRHSFSVVNPLYQQSLTTVYDGKLSNILIGTAAGYTYSL